MTSQFRRSAGRVAVVAATAAMISTATTAVAMADDGGTTATTPAHTSLSIRAVHRHVAVGKTDTIKGDLNVAGLDDSNRPVELMARAKGADTFSEVASVVSGDKGGVQYKVTPDATTRYRWHYAGADDAKPSTSGGVTVYVHQVHKKHSSLSIRALRTHIAPGKSDRITGDLRIAGKGAEGRSVELLARPKGDDEFTPVAAVQSREHGGVSLQVKPETTTRYRWYFAGGTHARPSRSGGITVHVSEPNHKAHRLPSNLSIRAIKRHVPVGGNDTIKGHLRSRHTGLPNRTVVLVSRTAGGEWEFVAAHRSGAHGLVTFHVTQQATTKYQLRFLGTKVFRPSHSGTVAVFSPKPATTPSA